MWEVIKMEKPTRGLFVKSPDKDEIYRVISYTDGDGFVKCSSATVPLIDYKGRKASFTITGE